MADSIFFNPKGEKISREEFIRFYNQCYYLYVSPSQEQTIETILTGTNPLTEEEVGEILAWKTGGNYDPESKFVQYRYGQIFVPDVTEVLHSKERGALSENDAKELLTALCKIPKVGIVYAITLLYFFTNGQNPIYDKFAHIALMSITVKQEYGCVISDKELKKEIYLDKTKNKERDVEAIFAAYQDKYYVRLKEVFGYENYKASRDIDRALWVYGHLFSDNKRNYRRIEITE